MSATLIDTKNARALAHLTAARTIPDITSLALKEMPNIVCAEAVGVYLFSHTRLELRCKGVPEAAISEYLSMPSGGDPLLTRMQATGFPVHNGLLFSAAEWRQQPLYVCAGGPFGFEHYLVAPLRGPSGILGALALARSQLQEQFTMADTVAIATTSACMSVALVHSQYCDTSVAAAVSSLSPREREIAGFVAKGLSNLEIATLMDISANTIKKYLKGMFAKLNVSRRAELAWLATLGGLM